MKLIDEITLAFEENGNQYWSYSEIVKQLWAMDVNVNAGSVERRIRENSHLFDSIDGKYKRFRLKKEIQEPVRHTSGFAQFKRKQPTP